MTSDRGLRSMLISLAGLLIIDDIQKQDVMKLKVPEAFEPDKFYYTPPKKAQYKSDKPKVRSGSFKRNKRKSK